MVKGLYLELLSTKVLYVCGDLCSVKCLGDLGLLSYILGSYGVLGLLNLGLKNFLPLNPDISHELSLFT